MSSMATLRASSASLKDGTSPAIILQKMQVFALIGGSPLVACGVTKMCERCHKSVTAAMIASSRTMQHGRSFAMSGHRVSCRGADRVSRDWLRGEPSLEELLCDPVLGSLLRSDRVDPRRFRAFLQGWRASVQGRDT